MLVPVCFLSNTIHVLSLNHLPLTGFTGDVLDVTSMDSDASAVLSGNPFSPGGLDSPDSGLFDSLVCGDEDDVSEALLSSLPPHFISTLTALQEQFLTDLPATDSLDAFLNLDMMLDQVCLFFLSSFTICLLLKCLHFYYYLYFFLSYKGNQINNIEGNTD